MQINKFILDRDVGVDGVFCHPSHHLPRVDIAKTVIHQLLIPRKACVSINRSDKNIMFFNVKGVFHHGWGQHRHSTHVFHYRGCYPGYSFSTWWQIYQTLSVFPQRHMCVWWQMQFSARRSEQTSHSRLQVFFAQKLYLWRSMFVSAWTAVNSPPPSPPCTPMTLMKNLNTFIFYLLVLSSWPRNLSVTYWF